MEEVRMEAKTSQFKTKVKDWFTIQRIRLTNFMKEHKYVSAAIGVFLMSSILGIIAFAADDQYAGKVSVSGSVIVKDTSSSSDTDITKIKSFDTMVLDIPYKLSVDNPPAEPIIREKVIIEATYAEGVDANWIINSDDANYEIDTANRKLTATVYNVRVAEQQKQSFYLKVNNMANGSQVKVSVRIKESTAADFVSLGEKSVAVESKKVDLTARIISGTAYKNADFTGGRYAPYGILVGFDKGQLIENNSLRGIYFDPSVTLTMEAYQTVNGNTSQIELETNNKYFGLYDKALNLFNAPHYVYDYTDLSVFNSGVVESLKTTSGGTGEVTETVSQDLYLVGSKTVELKLNQAYTEQGIKTSENGAVICKTTSGACKRTITNEAGEEVTATNMVKTAGTYKVSYEYKGNKTTTTANRTVVVKETQTIPSETQTLNEVVYTLLGDKNMTVTVGEKFTDPGVSPSAHAGQERETIIRKDGDDTPLPTIDTTTTGTYTITYTITDSTLPEGENSITFERTVTVVEEQPVGLIKSATVKASTIYLGVGANFNTPKITINDRSVDCNEANKCSVKYYDASGTNETTINTSKAGSYVARYQVTDDNGFVIVVESTINIQVKYELKITGIKTNGTYYTTGNFLAFGSYYVTAKSPRETGVTADIAVNLKVGNVTSDPITNQNVSEGTKTNRLTFNSDASGTLSTHSENDYISYGEEVILRSLFTYSADGDNNIGTLTTRVPVNVASSDAPNPTAPFTMVEYAANVEEGEKPYYVNETMADAITVKYFGCEMDEAATSCKGNPTSYDTFEAFNDASKTNERLKLAYLEYTATGVKPGTRIDFRIRLKANVGNQSGKVSLSSNSTYDGKTTSSSSSINITAFKARTKVLIGDSEQDTIIDGANVNTSTWSIYPTVSLPAELVSTNAAGINDLDEITITVTLPSGVNLVYNENYMRPTVSGRTLTYVIKGKKVNDWIEPIYFDTSYDISIPSGTKLDVSVEIQATSNKISDSSSKELRTTTRSVTYQNSEVVSYGQYTPYTAIAKNTAFDVTTKLYNNSSANQSNLDVVTLLPYNDVSNEDNTFTGTYTISNVPSGALCTTALPSIISNTDKLLSGDEITWEDCTKYATQKYVGVTAIRVNGISLTPGRTHEHTIKITPSGNKTDDSYEVNSYLLIDSGGKRVVKNIKPIRVTVVSKKITGTVWEDFDANGIMDPDEKKVSGVTMKLYKSETGELVTTATSDEKGNYALTDLDPGKYYVVAEYNTAKYGLSPYQASYDKSISSAFTVDKEGGSVVTPEEPTTPEETEPNEPNPDEENPEKPDEDILDEKPVETPTSIVKTEDIEVTNNTTTISNINLGLALRKIYAVKLNKYITRTVVTNRLGIPSVNEYGNVTLAKLDVKDLANLSIKVVYTLELENVGYYPGYIYKVKDYIPDGMTFNPNYEENKGWTVNDNGYAENRTLASELIRGGEKKYLTIAYDISRKEAGSFINYAAVDDDDLQILTVAGDEISGGSENE